MPVDPEVVAGLGLIDSPSLNLPVKVPTLISSGGTLSIIPAGSSTANPVGGSGSCSEDVWGGSVASFVAVKAPTLTNVVFRSRCSNGLAVELSAQTINGSGSATPDTTSTGGVISNTTGATGSSRAYFTNVGKNVLVPSLLTAKFAVFTRAKIVSVNATCILMLMDATDTATTDCYIGVLGTTSTANYSFVVGSASAQNTGVAIDNSYHTLGFIADGTNVTAWNVDTGVQIGTPIAQSNLTNVNGHFRFDVLNQGTASAVASKCDDIIFITEQAA